MIVRLPGHLRRSTLLAVAAGLLVVVVGLVTVAGGFAGPSGPQRATPFTLPQLSGHGNVSLRAYSGRPLVLNFFASWCGPCRKETPLLAGFYRSHRGQVLIIGIDANDHLGAASAFVRAHGVTYPVAFDPSAWVTTSYGIAGLPQTLFLNSRHQIVRHIYGALTLGELDSWAASISTGTGA